MRKSLKQRVDNRRIRRLNRLQVLVDWHGLPPEKEISSKLLRRILSLAWLEKSGAQVNIHYVSSEESQQLNRDWRQKDKPTNILSFPFELPEGWVSPVRLLGDLVICIEVCKQEAVEQHKSLSTHLAHLWVHGMLHLQDYDHETESEAVEMEACEVSILKTAGFKDPYAV